MSISIPAVIISDDLGNQMELTPLSFVSGVPPATSSLPFQALYNLNQALQALEPAPNATTVKFNDTVLVDAGVVNQTTTINDGNITITGTGLNNNPLLTLNQGGTGSAILYEEFYNQRTAQTGEFNRMSFYGKSSTGVKTEYARIHQNAPVITTGSVRGRIDMAVQQGSGLVDYLTLNGQVGSVGLGATLDCNSNNITEINTATTANGFQIGSQSVNFLIGDDATPAGTKDNNMRAVYINTGVPDTLETVAGTFPSTWGNILCSTTWSSSVSGTAFWVGTDTGKLYWTNNNGSSWNIANSGINDYTFNAKIRCLMAFSGNLWIGGDFTGESFTGGTYNYIAYLDTNEILQPANWSSIMGSQGVNASVWTMVENSSYLFFGGAFTADGSSVLGINKLASVDGGFNLYDTDGQTSGFNGNGFFGGQIEQILISGSYLDNMAVCGDISSFNSNSQGSLNPCDGFAVWRFGGNASNQSALYPIFQGISVLNAKSLSVLRNGGNFYIGGNFTNTQEVGTGNPLPYFVSIVYDGSTAWNQDTNPYTFVASNPINKQLHLNGLWWADSAGALYKDGNYLVNAPFGASWSWIGDETTSNYFSTNSPTQNPITMYFWNTSDVINIALSNPLLAPDGNLYTNNLVLNALGSTAELVWSGVYWYVLSTQGGVGYS